MHVSGDGYLEHLEHIASSSQPCLEPICCSYPGCLPYWCLLKLHLHCRHEGVSDATLATTDAEYRWGKGCSRLSHTTVVMMSVGCKADGTSKLQCYHTKPFNKTKTACISSKMAQVVLLLSITSDKAQPSHSIAQLLSFCN